MKQAQAALAKARIKELVEAKSPEQMLEAFRGYLEVQPGDALAWTDMAGLLLALGRLEEAGQASLKALSIQPLQTTARFHLGCASLKLGRVEEAEGHFRRIIASDDQNLDAWLQLAKCRIDQQDTAEALDILARVQALDPRNATAHQMLGQIHYSAGHWTDFWSEVERFRRLDPASRYVVFESGFVNLLHGRMREGWPQWEARLDVPGCIAPERHYDQPRWQGETFAGQTLLVHYEQGFGDTLMLVRYLPMVKARGGRVLLLAQPQLADLVATAPGADQVIAEGSPLPEFDLQVSLYSLPAVFQTDVDTIPAPIPYLDLPEWIPNRARIAAILAASEGMPRVGLAWAGHPGHPRDRERSIPLAQVNRLAALPGVAWHSFQLRASQDPELPHVVSLAPLLESFSDTAYALSGMDLVITVDTALAHLAGAMGIPTLLLVTFSPDFRWMLQREDSPWYPTLRIYRQPRPGDWDSVMLGVLEDLASLEQAPTDPEPGIGAGGACGA